MTTQEALRLTTALEALIDARLETIDRMLLDRVHRQDRLAIVRDVEAQIHEQLQSREANELSRADVLAVLAALDPPEAYLPEASDEGPARPMLRSTVRSVATMPAPCERPIPGAPVWARTSGILGIAVLVGAFILPALVLVASMFSESETIFIAGMACSTLLVLTGGIVGIVFAGRAGLRYGWSVAGLVTSLASLIIVLINNVLGFFAFG